MDKSQDLEDSDVDIEKEPKIVNASLKRRRLRETAFLTNAPNEILHFQKINNWMKEARKGIQALENQVVDLEKGNIAKFDNRLPSSSSSTTKRFKESQKFHGLLLKNLSEEDWENTEFERTVCPKIPLRKNIPGRPAKTYKDPKLESLRKRERDYKKTTELSKKAKMAILFKEIQSQDLLFRTIQRKIADSVTKVEVISSIMKQRQLGGLCSNDECMENREINGTLSEYKDFLNKIILHVGNAVWLTGLEENNSDADENDDQASEVSSSYLRHTLRTRSAISTLSDREATDSPSLVRKLQSDLQESSAQAEKYEMQEMELEEEIERKRKSRAN